MNDPVFDKRKPYGEVFGSPGVRYLQNGKYFSGSGKHVPELTEVENSKERKVRLAAEREARKVQFQEEFNAGKSVTIVDSGARVTKNSPLVNFLAEQTPNVIDDQKLVDNVEFDSIHWKTLKKMVEERGGQYQGKLEAIDYLKGL